MVTATLTRFAAGLLPSALLVGSSAIASPTASPIASLTAPASYQSPAPPAYAEAADTGVTYMPLDAGRRLTYETSSGERFSLTFGEATIVPWFDGTQHTVVPVTDTRCNCEVLYANANGEIRAVGVVEKGKLYTWGEYFVVWPADAGGETETVTTPAGRFDGAARITMPEGNAWFAPGVGIIKADGYALAEIETIRTNHNGGMQDDGTQR